MANYNGIIISDIHVGAGNSENLYEEYNKIFIDYIKSIKQLDFVIVCGDFFDHKFYLSDRDAILAYIMINELINVCKEKHAKLRFVYGTESHECNQYDILNVLKIDKNIRIIKTVSEEELLPGMHVLYIPEEHIIDKNEHYKEVFSNNKKYDYVFGHGVIREVMKELAVHIENNNSQSSNKRKKVPIFTSTELSYICKGQSYFGHYHINKEYEKSIFSIGSFSRWIFGEEDRKGFYYITCDSDKEKYSQSFIENTLADEFKTVKFEYDNKIFNSYEEFQASIEGINKMLERNAYNHVRFMFNIPNNINNPEALITLIKEKFKYKNNVKVELTNGYIEERKKIKKEQVEKNNKMYSFIFNNDITIEDKAEQFISVVYNKDIPSNRINDYLYKPLSEIIETIDIEDE